MFRSPAMLIACALLTSCCMTSQHDADGKVSPSAQPAVEPMLALRAADNAEAEVRQASNRFWSMRDRHDAQSLAAEFTATAVLMIPGLPDAVGRSAIRDLLQQRFANIRNSDLQIERREIQVSGDTAHELGWFAETNHANESAMRMQGRYLIVWKHQPDNVWRVDRHLSNFSAVKPLPPPAN